MKNVCAPFEAKKITLLGLGLLGRGIGDAIFFAECNAQVIVTDKKSESELAEAVGKLKKYPTIQFRLGGHNDEDFKNRDLVIKAAGVPQGSHEIEIAKKNNVQVAMSTALFAKYAAEAGATIVGVTGTRGKSTVSQMIYHSLQEAGKKVHLGGNVRGISTLAMLPEIEAGDICVLELDSWQLQGFGDLQISPHIAAFTNLMPDHQNYYKSMDDYFSDKANVFRFQHGTDFLFVGKHIFEKVNAMQPAAAPQVPENIPDDWKLKVVGEHNRENASLAAAALRALQLSEAEIKFGIETFEAVEGRLQFVREMNGVKIYNDNNATTPEATIAALTALGTNITLIVGGSEKDLDLTQLVASMRAHVSHVILLTHDNYKGSTRLANELRAANIPFDEVTSLQEAVGGAMQKEKQGTILFSPAFASFGMFKNEYERNDQFLAIIRAL